MATAVSLLAQTSGVLEENFESVQSQNLWVPDHGVWEIGKPPQGAPTKAHEGSNCAGTVFAGFYPEGANSRLVGPRFRVPAISETPRLRFYHWFAFAAGDAGRVQLKPGTNDWVTLSPIYTQTGGAVWTQVELDLSTYAGQNVQLAFLFTSDTDGSLDAGWYLDEIQVITGPLTFNNPETWENGIGDWYADGGI